MRGCFSHISVRLSLLIKSGTLGCRDGSAPSSAADFSFQIRRKNFLPPRVTGDTCCANEGPQFI